MASEFEKWLEKRWGKRWREIHEPWELGHLCAAWNAAVDASEEVTSDYGRDQDHSALSAARDIAAAIRALREEDPDA